jgi:hypothetical protein
VRTDSAAGCAPAIVDVRAGGMSETLETPEIFISYRRSDASDFAGRLYDRPVQRFGEARVFMDVASIG